MIVSFAVRPHPDRTHRIRSHAQSYTGYAYSLGLISSVVIGFVWLPQIYVTYKNKVRYQHHTCALTWRLCSLLLLLSRCVVCVWQDTGALSIAMLLIQAPGNILVVCFQVRFNIYGLLPKPGTD